ncbi:hypothetical protein MMC21_003991 [Puttea exsequens]|nr:hypothetical protein [Puttea exsequens]
MESKTDWMTDVKKRCAGAGVSVTLADPYPSLATEGVLDNSDAAAATTGALDGGNVGASIPTSSAATALQSSPGVPKSAATATGTTSEAANKCTGANISQIVWMAYVMASTFFFV